MHSFRLLTLGSVMILVGAFSAQADAKRSVARRHAAPPLHQVMHHERHFVRPSPGYGWEPNNHGYFGPGYVFVPGKGISDEACDLPTSACPNDVRPN